jgi:ABC-type multidrug transport system ATPase subunit
MTSNTSAHDLANHAAAAGVQTAPAILTDKLTKRYGQLAAVDQLSIQVPAAVVAGFVGPNGAGKTTTIRMLLGLAAPTAGAAWVLGQPVSSPAACCVSRHRRASPAS